MNRHRSLTRTAYGPVRLGRLKEGGWRRLKQPEVVASTDKGDMAHPSAVALSLYALQGGLSDHLSAFVQLTTSRSPSSSPTSASNAIKSPALSTAGMRRRMS